MEALWRRGGPDDDASIADRFILLNLEDPGDEPVTRDQIIRTLTMFREEPLRGVAVVLQIDGIVHGYALLVSFWSNELGGEVCIVDELYVDPDFRGLGMAQRLFSELTLLWGRPHIAHALETTSANARARAFYERLGFTGSNTALVRRRKDGHVSSDGGETFT